MALPATDTFTRGDSDDLGTNWTPLVGNLRIISNQAGRNAGADVNVEFWNADTFNSDHYSQCVFRSAIVGPAVRLQETGNGYYVRSSAVNRLYRIDAGVPTELQLLDSTPLVTGDIQKLTVEGSTLKVYKNGGQLGTNQTDATHTGGAAGLHAEAAAGLMDDWEGGDMGGAASPPPLLSRFRRGKRFDRRRRAA